MQPSKRVMWLVSMVAVVAMTAACGGQPAEQAPAEQPAATEEPAPAAETAPAPEPEMMPEEPPEPAQPQIQGNIVEVGEAEMDWFNAATRTTPGRYFWEVKFRNDTTQTLDITVTFQFVDENDNVIKTDRKTERVQPAETGTFRYEGEMQRDQARAVVGYVYSPDWKIVENG